MNWGLLEDKQRFRISIPVGKMSAKETRALLEELIKMFPDLLLARKLKIDKIMRKINGKEL